MRAPTFADQLPGLINDAKAGRGPVGDLLQRTNALQYVQDNQDRIRQMASGLTTPAAGVLRGVATGIAGAVTIFVLSYLMVLEGPKMVEATLNLLRARAPRADPPGRHRLRQVRHRLHLGQPADQRHLRAAHLRRPEGHGRAVRRPDRAVRRPSSTSSRWSAPRSAAWWPSIAGFIHSVPAGIVVLVFFVVYQQLENHLLQPLIFSRTVKLNPLTVLVAILVGVELAGVLGALLAIPFAGIIQVIIRDVWDHRRGRLKGEPTTGEDEHRPGEERPAPLTS